MTKIPKFFIVSAVLSLIACSSKSKESNLTEIPEICRGYDFASDPEMADFCGIRKTRYVSYKNIPAQRYLISPKGAYLAKSSSTFELRLPNTLPVELDKDAAARFNFNKEATRLKIRNQYIYKELYPSKGKRIKIFKIIMPTEDDMPMEICFNIPQRKLGDRRKRTHSSNQVEKISCKEFTSLVDRFDK